MYVYIYILTFLATIQNALCTTEDGRLPTTLKPVRYTLRLRPVLDRPSPPFPFNGSVTIHFSPLQATNEIIINSAGLAFSDTFDIGTKANSTAISILSYSFDTQLQWAILKTSRVMEVGEKVFLSIDFSGFLRAPGEDGFWWDSYSYGNTTKYMAVTQLEPTSARYMFPAFDEVDMKAVFDVTVEHRPYHVALANTELVSSAIAGDNWIADTFSTTPIMSAYLVAIAVGEFVYVEATAPANYPVKLRIYATEKHIDCMSYAANHIFHPSLDFMEKTTSIPFQLKKLDIIAYPHMSGAMENWGLITFSEEFMCIHPDRSSAVSKLTCAKIMSHELAHQWYGNLVTNKWWDDMWLHEGFANNYNYYPLEAQGWEGTQLQQGDPERGTQQFFDTDAKNTSDAIRKNISSVAQAEGASSGSTYPKGGAILRMIRGIMGRAPMERALTNYLTKFQYSMVTTSDLYRELTAEAAAENITLPDGKPIDFETILDPWLNQMGFPIVNVTRSISNKSEIHVSRGDKFLNPSTQNQTVPGKYNYKWPIPITVLVQGEEYSNGQEILPVAWIDINDNSARISIPTTAVTGWYLINAMQNFFFRVNYGDDNLAQIAQQLSSDFKVIPDESRSQVIDDAFTLSKNGYLTIDKLMPLTSYLNKEISYNPVQSILKHASIISGLVSTEDWYSAYQEYYTNLLEPQVDRLGWSFNDTETIQTQFFRTDVIYYSCFFLSNQCIDKTSDMFKNYAIQPSVNSVDPNLLPTVLCTGVWTNGGWQLVFDQYRARAESQNIDERYAYLFALSCTVDIDLIGQYYLETIKPNGMVASRDKNQAAQYLASNPIGSQLMYEHVTNHWDRINPSINKVQTISTITSSWKTEEYYQLLMHFIDSRNDLTTSEYNGLTQCALKIQQNIRWFSDNASQLRQWLSSNRSKASRPVRAGRLAPTSASHWRSLEAAYDAMLARY